MKGIGLLLFLVYCTAASAQLPYSGSYLQSKKFEYTLPIFGDSTPLTDPQKATYLAMVLPGSGQLYNKKIWKAGIVYGGIAGLIYFNRYSVDSLKRYELIYTNKIDGDSNTIDNYPQLSTTSAKNFRDLYRRRRDVSILGFVGLYAIQIIDANVDAHLKEFKLNEELSLQVTPNLYAPSVGLGQFNGLSLRLTF
ncbi:MAG: hypothetical protein RLZZ337_1041 [Bacteroidota bacterium]|jgi:hypothetical protein